MEDCGGSTGGLPALCFCGECPSTTLVGSICDGARLDVVWRKLIELLPPCVDLEGEGVRSAIFWSGYVKLCVAGYCIEKRVL